MSENTDLTYYQRNKESSKKQARDKYRNLSEEKNKKTGYGINWYHNVWKNETKTKRILKKLSKNYCEKKKPQYKKE